MQLLQLYLSIQDAVLEELRPIAKQVAAASGTVVVMVCNAGHAELLLNFICAAHAVGVDLSSFLLFATDMETKLLADQLQLTAYYNNKLFSAIPNGDATIEYGTKPYARVMMSKVYCVHLISSLGHDLFFQDVDLVPYRKDYIEHFIGAAKAFSQFDLYFQYDHSTAPRYLPWSANSGFYYARSNVKTRYFFSVLLRLGDLVLQSKSHQAAMAALLSEHASLFGLRAKTMHEETRNYPGKFQ
jgi:Nucleotide-diphospho-sugar transferase